MQTKSSIISVIALMSAMSFAAPAYAQDAGVQVSGQAGANAGAAAPAQPDAGAGAAAGGDVGVGAGADAGGGAAAGGDAGAAAGGDAGAQGGAAAGGDANVNVTNEQQTEIHSAVTELNVAPVTDINIDINVGVAVPQTITLQPLPARVVTLVPQFAGYLFFLLPDGRIVIVAPTTLKIVYILAA